MTLNEVDCNKLSPMMKQYYDIKIKYQKYVVFFRLGDFYEMFFDDAVVVSREIGLTLTGRDCGIGERVPMCGVPFHSYETYLKKLLDKGYKIAICEQLSDPNDKGIVVRDVVKIVTPGTITQSDFLDESTNNYISALFCKGKAFSLCFADISTGEAHLYNGEDLDFQAKIIAELSKFSPVEIMINDECLKMTNVTNFIKYQLNASVNLLDDDDFSHKDDLTDILNQFSVATLDELNLANEKLNLSSFYALFSFIKETQKSAVSRFSNINIHLEESTMKLGFSARRNLEISETMRNKDKKGSLLWVLDKTYTSMGKRLLKNIVEQPLISPVKIIERLDAVEEIMKNPVLQGEISENLDKIYDLERLMAKVVYKNINPRELKTLSSTALRLPILKNILGNFNAKLINTLNNQISSLEEVSNLIENSIVDEQENQPIPTSLKDGGVIKSGFNAELDRLRDVQKNGKNVIEEILEREKNKTGIKGLKSGYNKVFGYFFEVTKSYYDLIPETYIRKQTLANCERFITQELKDVEVEILSADEKILTLESEIFIEVRDFIATLIKKVSKTASAVAMVDVLNSFAKVAVNNNYTKPEISIDGIIDIKNGRHPVVEFMQNDEIFVPNDAYLDITDNKMLVITGPNMSGKSTYMRQIALITLMSQIGSFVPCDYAKISVVDQIFTRVGASDDLSAGQSTFMVEMSEVADILKNATKHSLVILDEVGRGTSTFDGLSIAKAVCEHIASAKNLGCKTLFATHYHELIELENEIEGVKNLSVAVNRGRDGIQFLRKIVPGGVDESYGIEVAKLAGLPSKVVKRASDLLLKLESEQGKQNNVNKTTQEQFSFSNFSEKSLTEKLKKTNVDELSDQDAKLFLTDLIKHLD